jgi:hypothetical protein
MEPGYVPGMLAVVAALIVIHPLPAMKTPTGNISCFVTPAPYATLHCSLKQADYAHYMQTVKCGPPIGLDWAGFGLGAFRKARVECSGGILYNPSTQKPHYVIVPYGHTWRAGPFGCHSQFDGLNCSSHTGHGFFISRQTWRTW